MRRSRVICCVLAAAAVVGVSLASEHESSAKRVPLGFQGVRGKKSIQDTYTYPDNAMADPSDLGLALGLDKRIPSAGFHGMRGKKLYPERDDLPKRAPMGFLGMRGKKEMEMVNYGDDYYKRAPLGFMGMRGKKESELLNDEDPIDINDYYMDKRAPMGFMGMRGKKEYEPFEEEKRAPANGFFGMRGKKQPSQMSSFFGMRGKKYPYEFRGKFVGVRGKKQYNENAIPIPEDAFSNDVIDKYAADLNLNELMMLLTEHGNDDSLNWDKRKGPSGFLGMRG